MKREDINRRLATLAELINRKSTPEGERRAAQIMRDRLNARLADLAADPTAPATYAKGFVGSQYKPGRTLTDIAKLIRADIKAARAVARTVARTGDLVADLAVINPLSTMPTDARVSVAQRRRGSCLTITVKGLPDHWWNPTEHGRYEAGPGIRALATALHDIANAYRYDRSDASTDLLVYNYVVSVTFPYPGCTYGPYL